MSEKYLIFGATGSIGSSLAEQLVNSGNSVHLVGRNENEIKMMTVNFIDIHARLKIGWLLPLSNYSLKKVAQWLKFRWTYRGSNGARALLWWRQWKRSVEIRSQESNKLERILKYNQDDCIATWKIAEWLLNKNKP